MIPVADPLQQIHSKTGTKYTPEKEHVFAILGFVEQENAIEKQTAKARLMRKAEAGIQAAARRGVCLARVGTVTMPASLDFPAKDERGKLPAFALEWLLK